MANAGHEVSCKRNGQEALDALDELRPDVIVLELQLGTHNGVEYIYEIKSQSDWQNIPIIVHSLNSRILDDEYQKAFNQLGIKHLLYKPTTSIAGLLKAIEYAAKQ